MMKEVVGLYFPPSPPTQPNPSQPNPTSHASRSLYVFVQVQILFWYTAGRWGLGWYVQLRICTYIPASIDLPSQGGRIKWGSDTGVETERRGGMWRETGDWTPHVWSKNFFRVDNKFMGGAKSNRHLERKGKK